ncbi:MAG: ATP-binding cassette domain-containing protein [Chloroflexi bacterium]|nr:ATP-binding cassette domain-containing protein [Chloroflexota bacterium]
MSTVLDVWDIHKRFKRQPVLRGASLSVERGEVVGIVGENGSGKSTLLRIIAGLLHSDRGHITINGRYGYCPQEPVIFDGLTMEENIDYFSAAYGLSKEEGHTRGEALMERLRCRQQEGKPAAVSSGGTRQKLNLILALLNNPDLLLLDEPYQGFDWESYLTFWSLAKEMAATGQSVVVVSHLVHDRSNFSRLYTLKEGVVVNE